MPLKPGVVGLFLPSAIFRCLPLDALRENSRKTHIINNIIQLQILGYVSYGLVLEKIKVSTKIFLFYVNLRLLVNGVPVPSNKF